MIEKTQAYKVGDKTFATLAEAQHHELEQLLAPQGEIDWKTEAAAGGPAYWAARIVDNRDAVVDILTTGPNSKPRARSIHGGKKVRKAKDQTPVPGPAN